MNLWCVFIGNFKQGHRSGTGSMMYANGASTYIGEWKANQRHGFGKMQWKQQGSGALLEEYSGQWQSGKQHGYGIYIWHAAANTGVGPANKYFMENYYAGEFFEGKRKGKGVFRYASGEIYKGNWVDNKKHGHGLLLGEDGRTFNGEFVNDRMQQQQQQGGQNTINTNNSGQGNKEDSSIYQFWLSDFFPKSSSTSLASINESIIQLNFRLNTITERHQHFLRALYIRYARLINQEPKTYGCIPSTLHIPPEYTITEQIFTITQTQFWRLIKDSQILLHNLENDLNYKQNINKESDNSISTSNVQQRQVITERQGKSLINLGRAIAKNFKGKDLFEEKFNDPNSHQHIYNYFEYLSCLIRTGHYCYGKLNPSALTLHEKGVAASFDFLLETGLTKLASWTESMIKERRLLQVK